MYINIFLDDIRNPDEAFLYTKNNVYLNKVWTVVKNYKEFVELLDKIKNDGNKIGTVSFDHDLAIEHYNVPFEIFNTYSSEQLNMEKTGYDCVKYFTNFIDSNNMHIPGILFHTMNPVGKEIMTNYIMDWMDSHGGKDS